MPTGSCLILITPDSERTMCAYLGIAGKIDDNDISKVTQDSLRSNIAVVTQDTALLHRSIKDNILYGNPNADDEELFKAAKQAEAYDFILDLEDKDGRKGFDAYVGERGVRWKKSEIDQWLDQTRD